jgi:hypothetical protein
VLQPCVDVVYRRLGDTGVLVHLGTNEIFEINDTGARIWELLAEGQLPEAIVGTLVSEFDIDPPSAQLECRELIDALVSRKLLEAT